MIENVPTIDLERRPDEARAVVLRGPWRLEALAPRLGALEPRLAEMGTHQGLWWDLTGLESLDSVAAAVLWRAWRGVRPPGLIARAEHETLFARLARAPEAQRPEPVPPSEMVAHLGEKSLHFVDHVLGVVALFGQVFLDLLYVVRHPSRAPWRDTSAAVYRAGMSALPITAMVGFLIGVVVSYLSSQQLRTFGANIFIINLLGISILRELGPLLAAILVAGRSGSAMTAQIGVMRLTQELDALSVMGISRSLRLVLPRVLALALAMPLLTLWTNALALLGGMLAAQNELGIGITLFIDKLPDAVPISNLWLGLSKGVVFGVLVALVSCHFGLRIEPNTRSLGAGTTRAVVVAITLVILADALFAVVTSHVGLP